MPAMDATTKLTLGAGFALAILGLLGVAIGTWNFSWSGIILILAGLVGAAGGWIAVTNAGKTLMIAAARHRARSAARSAPSSGSCSSCSSSPTSTT